MRIPISPPWIAMVLRPDPACGSSQRGDRAVTTVVPGRIGMLILLDALAMPTPGASGHSVTALKGYPGDRRVEVLSAGVSASGNHGSHSRAEVEPARFGRGPVCVRNWRQDHSRGDGQDRAKTGLTLALFIDCSC